MENARNQTGKRTFGFQWHLTNLCNGHCRHCYQDSFTARADLNAADQMAMADEIFSALSDRLVSVNITGGEPMLLDHLPDLLSHLGAKGNLDELWVITNGTIVNEKLLDQLRQIKSLTGIKVSLEAADPAINDSIRWPGHLDSLNANMSSFLSLGKQVLAMLTLSDHNLRQIGPVVDWAKKSGCNGVMFERFIPLGRGLAMKEQVLDSRRWLEACDLIGRLAGVEMDKTDASVYKAFWISFGPDEDSLLGAFCNLGDESMALMPGGEVFPCRRLPIELGRIPRDDFGEILEKLHGFSAGIIRPSLTGTACGNCTIDRCAGCRALAKALSEDFLADDPGCPGP